MYTYICICELGSRGTRQHRPVSICVHTHMYVYIYIHVYTYTYIYMRKFFTFLFIYAYTVMVYSRLLCVFPLLQTAKTAEQGRRLRVVVRTGVALGRLQGV